MMYVAVYLYIQPYKSWSINILEVVLLVDLLLILTISSTVQFKVTENVQFDDVINFITM